jgi:hypothetical protein
MMRTHFNKHQYLLWIIPLIAFIFFNTARSVSAQDGVLPLPGGLSREFADSQTLSATPADVDAEFGHAVAVNGEWMVVGAPYYGTGGAAFVFQRGVAGTWSQIAILLGSDTAADDEFGYAVAIEGGTIMVGARHQGTEDKGAAYVFTYTGGTWTEQIKLQPTLNNFAYFGRDIDIDGDRAVIAASGIGAAFVYQRDGAGVWALEIKLPTTVFDTFAVAIDGTRVAVSSLTEEMYSGGVYIYELVGGAWIETAHVTASDAFTFNYFGSSLEMEGNALFVGHNPQPPPTLASEPRATSSGAVYVFQYSAGTWTEQQILTANDGSAYDRFGNAVALQDNVLMIGRSEDSTLAGSVYRFDWNGSTWSQADKIPTVGGEFGFSLDLDQGTLVGGAPEASGEGRVYVYSDPALTPTELLVDGDFENNADGWEIKDSTGDKVKCNNGSKTFSYLGLCAWRFKGVEGENAKIQQTITSGVDTGDTLTLSGYVNATTMPAGKVTVVVKYADPSLEKSKITVEVNSAWVGYRPFSSLQPALTTTVTAPIEKIKVSIKNQGTSGKVYYDALSLIAS